MGGIPHGMVCIGQCVCPVVVGGVNTYGNPNGPVQLLKKRV